jgi:hypothetical protein
MVSTGLGKAALVEDIETIAESKIQQWDQMRAKAKTPDLMYLFFMQMLKDGSQSMRQKWMPKEHLAADASRRELLAQRASLRLSRDTASEDEEKAITTQIKKHDEVCRTFIKACREERLEELTTQLWDAKKNNRSREEHRIAALIAAQSRGPRKRKYNLAPTFKPTAHQHLDKLEQPGQQGGLDAFSFDLATDFQECQEAASSPPDLKNEHYEKAKEIIWHMKRYLSKAPKGKAAPLHSTPLEILLAVMSPNWRNKARSSIGQPIRIQNHHTQRIILELIVTIIRTDLTPYHFHISQGFELDKQNGKQGVDAIRIIHMFCALCKAFYRAIWELGPKPSLPAAHHGCAPHRRREGAVLVQDCLSFRLAKKGLQHVLGHKDQRNAFGCTKTKAQLDIVKDIARSDHQEFVKQHIRCFSLRLRCFDQEVIVKLRQGGPQGNPMVVQLFGHTFKRPILFWQMAQTNWDPFATACWAKCPITQKTVDLSLTIFVDDLEKTSIVQSGTAADVIKITDLSNQALTRQLDDFGYAIND